MLKNSFGFGQEWFQYSWPSLWAGSLYQILSHSLFYKFKVTFNYSLKYETHIFCGSDRNKKHILFACLSL